MDQRTKSIESLEMVTEKSYIQNKIAEACVRISSFALMKAWSKRNQECKEIKSNVAEVLKNYKLAESNLEYKKSMYYQKQKENEDLTCELRWNQKEVEMLNDSFKELTHRVHDLQTRKNELLLQFNVRCDECINTNMQISDLKVQLIENLENNQKLGEEIETEKSAAQKVNEQSNSLNNELNDLKVQFAENEYKLLKRINEIDDEIKRTKFEKKALKNKLEELNKYIKEYETIKSNKSGASMEVEKSLLYKQAALLRKALERTFENKLRKHRATIILTILEGLKLILPAFPTENFLYANIFNLNVNLT